eukprot:CAMPEP_0118649310 /NCGR_PEP_ID=MMETSP0785-20121206/9634_1 /TAXON_ID=91992 /ORGANISM="Bolidomonas pacifica, Strain CCMP 1866" /LENGTH=1294 /DNA_ID=CAMNT_0006541587 /DNA_START=22 /DNA_END=3903 /DNA_ORIENTATION=+
MPGLASTIIALIVLLPLAFAELDCKNDGYLVTDSEGNSQCFCVAEYRGITCNAPKLPDPETNSKYPCDRDLPDSDLNSCSRWLSQANYIVSDPLQSRVSFSDYDMREFDRLVEDVENGMPQRRAAVAIDEREVWYIVGDGSYDSSIFSYDSLTGKNELVDSLFTSSSPGTPLELVRSRHSEHVYLLTSGKIEKYDVDKTKVEFIDPSDPSKKNKVWHLESPMSSIVSMNQIPLAETVGKQSIILLLSDGSIWRVCDLEMYTALPGETDCQKEELTPWGSTTWDGSGAERTFLHGYDTLTNGYINYYGLQEQPSGMAVIPDSSGVFEFTVVITYFNELPRWISSDGYELRSCTTKPNSGGLPCHGFVEGGTTPNVPLLHTNEVYYDEGRDIVIFGEYSFGAPKAFTSTGTYLGLVGPKPGYHSSSTGLVVRPGPLARLSTFEAPTQVTAGVILEVPIYAKDYLNAPWTKSSPDNFKMKAHGIARSGAALAFNAPISPTNTSIGLYTGTVTLEETGTYYIEVTEGPGDQKLVHPDTKSDEWQAVVVNPAVTNAKYSEMVVAPECKTLKAGGNCDVTIYPKDIFGNSNTDLPSDTQFLMEVKNRFGRTVHSTNSSGTAVPVQLHLNSSTIENNLADKFFVEVSLGGKFILGSPYQLTVFPAEYDVDSVSVSVADIFDPGEELQIFEISLYDQYENFIDAEESHVKELEVEFYRPRPDFEAHKDKVAIDVFNKTVSPSGTIKVTLVDDKRSESDLRFTLKFNLTHEGGDPRYVINPEDQTEYFSISYKRSIFKDGLTPEIIAIIGASAVFIVVLASFLIYNEKLKTNKLKAEIKSQKFTVEEMRLLDEIMANSSFGDELTETTYKSTEVKIKKRLGMGAFGEVFLAEHTGQMVAIKTLKQISEGNVKRFRGEMVLIKALNHPSVVQYKGCVWDREMIGLMLEFVDGGALSDLLQDTQVKLDWEEPKLMQAMDIANAMVYLHSTRYWEDEKQEWMKCIIHRDLKPDNMLVVKDTMNVKLTDFGEARARKPDKTMTQVGTPIFIAPEVMKGDKYDERCDVFSYAVCLLDMMQISDNIVELFAEAYIDFKHTDAGLSLVAITHSVVTEGLRPKIPDYVPTSLKNLVEECWDVNPDARPFFPEIFDRLGYEVKAEVYGHKLDVEEQEKRMQERMKRLSNAMLSTNREKVASRGGELKDISDRFESSVDPLAIDEADGTTRLDTMRKEKQELEMRTQQLETECKTLRKRNDELNGLLSGGYVPGAGDIDDEFAGEGEQEEAEPGGIPEPISSVLRGAEKPVTE